MKINFHRLDINNDIRLPENINEINKYIKNTCLNHPALKVLEDDSLLKNTIKETNFFTNTKKKFVIFGTGGSNLGARALINILNNKLKKKIEFYDNIDPLFFEESFHNIDFNSTGFVIISKSGSTPETISQFGSIIEKASKENLLSKLFSNCLIITEFKNSPLYNLAKDNKCLLLEHSNKIGGRYSVFSNVGMVPAIIANMNVNKIQKGASDFLNKIEANNHFLIGQLFYFQKDQKISSNVLMTYSDSLYYFGKWYLQLWAESIGKNNKGITAIHSVGTTDQHSQLQLYLDGPKDKFFTFLTTNHAKKGMLINKDILNSKEIDYLVGKRMGDLMEAEQYATIDTFKSKDIRFRQIHLPKIDEETIGSIMAFSIVETIATCIYFKVDPFNQPAVEQGKILTKKYLS